MADRLRIVNLRWPRPPMVIADLSSIGAARDSFAIKMGDPSASLTAATNRWGGSRTVAERRQNATLTVTLMAIGTTPNAALVIVQNALEAGIQANTPDLAIEWRPDGASYSEYWRVRGPATYSLNYQWAKMASANYIPVDVSFPVAPTAVGAPYDIADDFSTDTVTAGDWIKDFGTASVAVSGGSLVPSQVSTVISRYRHARGYVYGDVEVTWKVTTGSVTTNGVWGVCLGMDVAGADTMVTLTYDGVNYFCTLNFPGTTTNLPATPLAVAANTTYYFLLRRAGNILYYRVATTQNWAEYTVEPNTYQLGTTATSLRYAQPGHVGFRVAPASTGETYDDFAARPFTYRGILSPERIQMIGAIVGEAPAEADIEITTVTGPSSASPPIFGLVAWGDRPQVQNLCQVGNYTSVSTGSTGWLTAAVTGIAAAGNTATRLSVSSAKYGGADLQIVTPATLNSGATNLIYRRFKRGKVYGAYAWLNQAAAGTAGRILLGVNGDTSTIFSRNMTAANQFYGTVWQPTADRDFAYIALTTGSAAITTFEASGVVLVESPTITLSAAIASTTATSMTVWYTPSEIPGLNPDGTLSAPFLVAIDQELVRVTAITGLTWTIDRAQEGTVGATHVVNSYVVVMPPSRQQFEGRGALAPFDVIEGEFGAQDRPSGTITASTNMRAGAYTLLAAAGFADYYVDPSAVLPDDFAQGDVLVEVWARLALDPASTGMSVVLSTNSSEQYDPTSSVSQIAGTRRYTLEYGSAGMSLIAPSGTNGTLYPQFFRLGTLPMVADRSKPQRWRVRLAYAASAGAGLGIDYLVVVPIRNRAATPTGKSSSDTTYPGFAPNFLTPNAITKTLRTDGSGLVRVPRLGNYTQPEAFPDAGLGHVIDMPNTDCDLIVKLSNLVPNDPGTQGQEMFLAEHYWQLQVHVAVTPRFVTVRGA